DSVQSETEADTYQPRTKTVEVAETAELAKRVKERFLRDIFRVGVVFQDTAGHAKRQGRGIGESRLEFATKSGAFRVACPCCVCRTGRLDQDRLLHAVPSAGRMEQTNPAIVIPARRHRMARSSGAPVMK